jgi:hypothetical protein
LTALRDEIDRLEKSIVEFDAALPSAASLFHRDWHLRILADYKRALNATRS